MKLAANQVPRRNVISFLFQSERDALEYISRNRLDESRTKNYFKEGLKVTVIADCNIDLLLMYNQVKDNIVSVISRDFYKLTAWQISHNEKHEEDRSGEILN